MNTPPLRAAGGGETHVTTAAILPESPLDGKSI